MTNIIKTTIPISPNLINNFCMLNATGYNDTLFEFDISDSPLSAEHILGYLSNLKINFRVVGFDDEFLMQYTKTSFMVGHSNLVDHHANLLSTFVTADHYIVPESTIDYTQLHLKYAAELNQQLDFIHNIVPFLISVSSIDSKLKQHLLGDNVTIDDNKLSGVGVNIARLTEIKEALLLIAGNKAIDIKNSTYYTHHYDEYIYDGNKLINYFILNNDCLLLSVVNSNISGSIG